MDNWSINLCDSSREHFELAMKMAFESNCPGKKVKFYALSDDNRSMVLIWGDKHKEGPVQLGKYDKPIPAQIKALPYEMDVKAAIDFTWHWLNGAADQGKEIWSDDVWREVGYRLHTNYWGHALEHHYGVIAITGEHALIGK
jgi:hypothetical protein